MTFQESVSSVLRQYARFKGRASRAEFWWFYLFTVLVGLVTGLLDGLLGTESLIGMVASLALLLPWLAVSVRRLHDSDLSGWWLAPIVVAGTIGFALFLGGAFVLLMSLWGVAGGATSAEISEMAVPAAGALIVGAVLSGIGFVGSLIMGLRRSTPGPNRFGPPPPGQAPALPYGQQPGGLNYPLGPGYGTPPPPPGAGYGSPAYPPAPGSSTYPPPPGFSAYPPPHGSSAGDGESRERRRPGSE